MFGTSAEERSVLERVLVLLKRCYKNMHAPQRRRTLMQQPTKLQQILGDYYVAMIGDEI